VADVSGIEIERTGGVRRKEVDVLIGGPPCQPFSKAGYWRTGDSMRLEDPRAGTLSNFMRIVAELCPRAFVIENVPGISYSGKDEGLKLIERWVRKINMEHGTTYRPDSKVINSVEYGVPQGRARFLLVADREGGTFKFPEATHKEALSKTNGRRLLDAVTAWDAIGDLNNREEEDLEVHGYWGKLLPSVPEGENYLYHTSKGEGHRFFGYRTRYWGFLLKLAKSRPSWTLQAQPGPGIGPFHWKSRRLSVDEMARLQTFPNGIKFSGNYQSVRRQIGNAVPSLMAESIAREIAKQIFRQRGLGDLKLSVRLRRPIPPPEEILPVPEEYLKHIGNHPDHPGPGNGPGAKLREARSGRRIVIE
jgi:DNA (cytosine-5)-methyltransferase 1